MIKPKFWEDEKLATISFGARLTYIALWNFSDDYAVVKGNTLWLKNNIYPYDEKLSREEFEGWVSELGGIRRIVAFDVKGEAFFWIPKFSEHQKIQKPSKDARNPPVPQEVIEGFLNSMGVVAEGSDSGPVGLRDEKKRKEEKRKEEKGMLSGGVQEIIFYLNQKTGANFNPDIYLTQTIILERLMEGFAVADFKAVIDVKTEQWLNDKKMSGNLRPATLFAADKFEGYLQEAKRNGSGEKIQTAKSILKFDGEEICRKYCAENGIEFGEVA
jgi:uncharacterized phage protein (TIGR02220 family)